MLRLAVALPFLFWALAVLTAAVVFESGIDTLYWLMIPFFLTRSLLAAIHIQSFSRTLYGDLLTSGVFLIVGFVTVSLMVGDDRLKLLLLSGVMVATFFILKVRLLAFEKNHKSRQLLWPSEWPAQIGKVGTPVRIHDSRSRAIETPIRPSPQHQIHNIRL